MSVYSLYGSIYKYTPCGPWLSVRLHDGSIVHCTKLYGIGNQDVRALLVGSMVEGSDAEVTADWIDLADPKYMEEGGQEKLVADFNATVAWVNDEACALWRDANEQDDDFDEFDDNKEEQGQ